MTTERSETASIEGLGDYAVAPGEYLQEWAEDHNVPHQRLAELLGHTTDHLSDIIAGDAEITDEDANNLESVVGIPAKAWLKYEQLYRADMKRLSEKERPPFAVTADIVLLTIRDGELCVLLVERGVTPFKGSWALPGGFLGVDESAEDAAVRELSEETGVDLAGSHIEQLKTYSAPQRDPRGRVVSTAFIALVPYTDLPDPSAGTDAAGARFFAVRELLDSGSISLAFDHEEILRDGVERVANKLEYTNLGATFLEEPFTLAQLREVYESVWGTELHPVSFRRQILSVEDFIEPVSNMGGSTSAQLYRPGVAKMLMPPMLRD